MTDQKTKSVDGMPREWWITPERVSSCDCITDSFVSVECETVRVIEYAAYYKLMEENGRLIKTRSDHLMKVNNELLKMQREALQKDCEMLLVALGEISKDFGTDSCDGNTMVAQEAIEQYRARRIHSTNLTIP